MGVPIGFTRKLGRVLKIHHDHVAKAWQRAGL
jgi:hypothetical protein